MAKNKQGYKELKVSLPKTLHTALWGIGGGNEKYVNRLVRLAIEELFREYTVEELQEMIGLVIEEEERKEMVENETRDNS